MGDQAADPGREPVPVLRPVPRQDPGYTYEVVEVQPGRKLVMQTAEGPFPMETTYTWEPVGPDATRMTLRNRGSPAGFSKLMAPFTAMAMRRATTKDLASIKAKLEGLRPAHPR